MGKKTNSGYKWGASELNRGVNRALRKLSPTIFKLSRRVMPRAVSMPGRLPSLSLVRGSRGGYGRLYRLRIAALLGAIESWQVKILKSQVTVIHM